MATEKQLKHLEEARTHIKNRAHTEETKRKIGAANDGNFFGTCDYCGKKYHIPKSHWKKSKNQNYHIPSRLDKTRIKEFLRSKS